MRLPGQVTATLVVVLAVGLGGIAPAQSDEDRTGSSQDDTRPDLPSQEQVDEAQQAAADKAAAVGRIKAALLLANQRLESAAVEAERAAEEANGARWRLELAGQAVERARQDAADARDEVARQRDAIGALVASSYQQGNELTALSAMMSADGPESVLDQYAGFQGASTSLQADYQRFAAADALAEVFERKAVSAERRQREVAQDAEAAQQRAASAADQAQAAADGIAAEKDELIHELAAAQDISVKLARQRQAALEEIARQKAEERARREAEAQARAEAAAKAKAEAEAKAKAEAEAKAKAKAEAEAAAAAAKAKVDDEKNKGGGTPTPAAPEPATPTPPSPPSPPAPPAPPAAPGGAQAAIDFARAQVGEPYRWGASGPTSWDCSGLTMGAWQAGGVSLPHYSVAQYFAGTPISAGQLQPGDLVFWSSSSSPQGIHHVALYLGDGMIVHAPRTGRPVTVESMYSWIPPTHFVRL